IAAAIACQRPAPNAPAAAAEVPTMPTTAIAATGASQARGPGPGLVAADIGLRLRRSLLRRAPVVAGEALRRPARVVVGDLIGRRLQQVGARPPDGAGDAVRERELAQPPALDHDPRRVRRVPDLELQLEIEGDVAEGRALHSDVRPLAVGQPRDV